MTDTMLNIINKRAENIFTVGSELLTKYSGTRPINTPDKQYVFISPSGDHRWSDLSPEGKQIQARLLPEIDHFSELVSTITQDLPSTDQKELNRVLKKIRGSIEQNSYTHWKNAQEAVEGFKELIDKIISTLSDFFSTTSASTLVVPDTNALMAKPDIERWSFTDVEHFTLILVPTVLAELDYQKVNHRNAEVREKASKIIRKIKEYRRRGSLHQGVEIVTGSISLRSVATEPEMSKTLSWFDSGNADDRFLATVLEVMRKHPNDKVIIVTADINMQNKAEMAAIPFSEVPSDTISKAVHDG